jgi:hypothetical protein
MSTQTVNSTETKRHSSIMQHALTDLVHQARKEIDNVEDPRFKAILETTAEVLIGLRKTFEDYSEGREQVWQK